VITDFGPRRDRGHDGSDTSVQDLIFRGLPKDDPLGLRADVRAAELCLLVFVGDLATLLKTHMNRVLAKDNCHSRVRS
jgi:hypothetical protein